MDTLSNPAAAFGLPPLRMPGPSSAAGPSGIARPSAASGASILPSGVAQRAAGDLPEVTDNMTYALDLEALDSNAMAHLAAFFAARSIAW